MVNYACGLNQSETGKYFEWIIMNNLQLDDVTGADFENSLYAFGQSEKRSWVQCKIINLIHCMHKPDCLC